MSGQSHWDRVYGAREEEALTWFEAEAKLSLELARNLTTPDQAVIDVGGGASRFVDGLLARGQARIAVLDLAAEALRAAQERIGAAAEQVTWIAADVTRWQPDQTWDLWHDRAVFHFLTEPDQRTAYFMAMEKALAPGGAAVIATFALDGPETCSQLPVQRWSAEVLAAEADRCAPGLLTLTDRKRHVHVTPKGNRQPFEVSIFRRQN